MACLTPLRGWKAAPTISGKGGFSFSRRNSTGVPMQVPCGKCDGCLVRRSREWASRCLHECSFHVFNSFITLTYAPEHFPVGGSLVLKDWQDFADRLRKRCGSFRYFYCGEYGDLNLRPHYHACLFGLDFPDKVLYKEERGMKLYTSRLLSSVWGKGMATIGSVTFESALYIAQYIQKHRGDLPAGLVPEFVHMSTRPAIGLKFVDRYMKQLIRDDGFHVNGQKYCLPRYYDKQVEKLFPEELERVKARRVARAISRTDKSDPFRLELEKRQFVIAQSKKRLRRKRNLGGSK